MFVDFDSLPDHSRIWVYQSDRKLTDEEVSLISEKLRVFTENWEAHTKPLRASFEIRYNHFIILAVDEDHNPVSGCSIDASTEMIRHTEQEFQINLLNRMLTAFKLGNDVKIVNLSRFKEMAGSKKISSNTGIFNNMIKNKKEYRTLWEVKASDSWHWRFLT